jgi:hypothetical protein
MVGVCWRTRKRPFIGPKGVPLTHCDYGPIFGALDQVTPQVLGHTRNRLPTNLALELADAPLGEIADDPPVTIELFVPKGHQPVEYQGRDAALLLPSGGMICNA